MDIYIPSSVLKDRHSTLRPHQQQPPQNLPPIVVVSTVAAESVAGGVSAESTSSYPSPHLYRAQRSNTNNYHLAEEEERFDRRNSEDEADEREYQEYKRLRKLKKQHKKEAKQMKALEKREKKEDKKMKREMIKNEKEMLRKKRQQQHPESHGGKDHTTRPTTTIAMSASLSAAASVANASDASAVATVVREQQYGLDGEEWAPGGQSTARKESTSRVRRSRVASWFLGRRKDGMASMQFQELELEPVQALFDQGKGQGGEYGDGQELQLPQQEQQHQQQQVWRREGTLSDLKVIPSQHDHNNNTLYSRKAASSVSLYLDPSSLSSLTLHPNHAPYQTLHQGPHRQSQLSSAVSEPHLGGGGRLGSGRKRTSTGCYLQRVWSKIRQSHKSASRLMMTPGSLQGDESSSRKDL
ncbi:hypothetical protein KVV02_007933 [Mortierella alpina]|uniref:Uncharacterized protein n=1 Tax=Mortierella alpina TaxID=64518 RepID=A0A9P8A4M2_MORAP|nr:hypothetical protein KVV02_007933 [Mortierella alpina]